MQVFILKRKGVYAHNKNLRVKAKSKELKKEADFFKNEMILTISTNKKQEIIDITHKINGLIRKSSIVNGLCHAFVKHTTAALIINENDDPDVCVDFLNALNKVFPDQAGYLHDSVDNNAGAHIKAAMLGPQIAVPIEKGKLALGRWQAIMFAEFDGPREKREIVISLIKTD